MWGSNRMLNITSFTRGFKIEASGGHLWRTECRSGSSPASETTGASGAQTSPISPCNSSSPCVLQLSSCTSGAGRTSLWMWVSSGRVARWCIDKDVSRPTGVSVLQVGLQKLNFVHQGIILASTDMMLEQHWSRCNEPGRHRSHDQGPPFEIQKLLMWATVGGRTQQKM